MLNVAPVVATMKHQYLGDLNDDRKYDLLRNLQRRTGRALSVW